jgi:formate hydrogenlyase subunit 3/multisubunit Na+/H+ antiporter MnhD subunit
VAPTHVSGLLSGVVIKIGIYGLMRVALLLGGAPAWWGWALLGLGMVSGILGVVWALAQHDLKRLLAFHSVENIGIILIGTGVGALGIAYAHPVVAVLGFAGALLHTVNHAVFKTLLFLGAGSVGRATGTRDIDRLGGLATWLPRTAGAFMIGSAAIVGLPPLNGFVSEWLVFRALLETGGARTNLHFAILAAVALALIGGLALACFTKVVGAVFLGVPRDPTIRPTSETPGLTAPVVVLAAQCVAIGVLPVLILPPAFRAAAELAGQVGLPFSDPSAQALTWGAVVLAAVVFVLGVTRAGLVRRKPSRDAATWGCGFQPITPRMQYTAASFAAPLLVVFRAVAGVRAEHTVGAFHTQPTDPILQRMIVPGWHSIRATAARLRALHHGRLSISLLYIVATLVVLLVYLVTTGGG